MSKDKKVGLWKYDSILGIAFFCPHCKVFIGKYDKCPYCGGSIDWTKTEEYKGKIYWEPPKREQRGVVDG